ncbi:hypothetical protein RIF29_22662 [Crotalaria pallida]|uniref:Uncharacterized protein n=1 Tax=Crotalaria pallida TaxID=3830 RepID=A0AAN9F9K0_CROPI
MACALGSVHSYQVHKIIENFTFCPHFPSITQPKPVLYFLNSSYNLFVCHTHTITHSSCSQKKAFPLIHKHHN